MPHTSDINDKGMFFTDRAKHLERQRSQPKIALSYIWHKHMCHGAYRDKGTQILKVRKVYVREIHSTPRPKENEEHLDESRVALFSSIQKNRSKMPR